ncbi:MAG: DNA-binding response regulator [Acholeplasma sp.]|jgi:DNA-binding response OmpR family regulator|nr:MAG: DNA-binding response regulator [Acholeplasma sp.]
MRILIVEDQERLRTILKERLSVQGYMVDAAKDGEEGLSYIQATTYDLYILDIMLPHISGLALLKYLRNHAYHQPVLLLTAKDAIEDRVTGLDQGADDYLVKPFAFEELLARIRSLLRRKEHEYQETLILDDLTLNRTTKEVYRNQQAISLTKKEYIILEYLMLHKGEVISRESLENISSTFDYEGYSNVVDVYIRFLRKKVDDPFQTKLIHTVRGYGYVMKVNHD